MTGKRNSFGIADPRTVTIKTEQLHLPYFTIIGLQPEQPEWEWLGLLHTATNWLFRKSVFHPYKESEYCFDTFYVRKRNTSFLPILLKNKASDSKTSLVAYHFPALHRIAIKSKTLPNQLSLFTEEDTPSVILDINDSRYYKHNPDDIRCWNEINAFLSRHSLPLDRFDYLLPVCYDAYELYIPLIDHLSRVKGLRYRLITGNEIGDDRFFYSFLGFEHQLRQTFNGQSSGKYSSKERSL